MLETLSYEGNVGIVTEGGKAVSTLERVIREDVSGVYVELGG